MANDAPPTPKTPPLPADYDPNMGVIAPGLVEAGNLELNGRPLVQNDDGTHSSEYSVSFGTDKGETLVPTVVNGRFLTPDGKKPQEGSQAEKDMIKAAEEHYNRTGEHLGIFDTPEHADTYANAVHSRRLRPGLTPADVQAAGGKTLSHPRIQSVPGREQGMETELKNQETENQGKADYKNWLYQNSPEEFKKAYPAEYLYRKGYNYVENAITAPATRPLTGKAKEEIEPKIHQLAEAGLGMYGLVKPGQAEPVIKEGVILPEGEGLNPEDIEAVGGRTIQPAPTREATVAVGGTGAASSEELARPDVFVKYSPSGAPTYLGKSPDSLRRLKSGEAIIGINKRTGGLRVQNTEGLSDAEALNKFGTHAKATYAPEAKVVPFVKPTAPDYAGAAKNAGVEFRGVQKGIEGAHPGLAIFQDPKSGTSVAVRLNEWSPQKLQEHIDDARLRMAPKAEVPAKKYRVTNTQTGESSGNYDSLTTARRAMDKKDMAHGGYIHKVEEIPRGTAGNRIKPGDSDYPTK